MVIQVSLENNCVVLSDNSGRVYTFSNDMTLADFNAAVNRLDFAYGLKRWAVRYFCLCSGVV